MIWGRDMLKHNLHAWSSLILIVLLASCGFADEFFEDFEQGLGGVKSYYKPPDAMQIELATVDAASGKQYARAALPGKKALEGFHLSATGLPGARLATVTAQVRGQGRIWLCLISRNGWLYSPQDVALTGQWQEVSLSKVLVAKDTTLGIHFLSRKAQPGAVFEVDSVRVKIQPPTETYQTTVRPWRLEAEDFTSRSVYVASREDALGGKMVAADQYLAVTGLPFPRTSRPVTIYARVKAAKAGDAYRLATRQGGNTQYLQTLKAARLDEWEWLQFEPIMAPEVGDDFSLVGTRESGSAGRTAIDSVVVSTQADLSPEQLAAAAPLLGRRPLAVVAKTATGPVIDGRPDDACWQNTVRCGRFLRVGSTVPTEAPTTVHLCYDDRNLYALVQCAEPILNTAQQRRHEFAAKVALRDGRVHTDDSAVLLLDPDNTGRQVYDFTVNALGTVNDARGKAPDFWATRDVGWNSGATAKGQIGEDEWSVEIAVPFADLGRTPQVGDTWQACLGRIAKARKETSSWNLSNKGFHDPVEFGRLVFGGPTPGVEANPPRGLQVGRNDLHVSLGPAVGRSQGVYLLSALGLATENRYSFSFHALGDKPQDAVQQFDVAAEAAVRTAYAVLDAGSLEPLYLTPVVTHAVKSSLATLTLTCSGPYELCLNDEVISRGSNASAAQIKAPLQRGANVFALSLQQGTAALKLAAPEYVCDARNWKTAPADAKTPTAMALDDRKWTMAGRVGTDTELGPLVGQSGQAVVLRKTILWEKTRVWPTPQPAFYLARGPAQHLTFIAEGLKGRKLENWTTYLAVGQQFEIAGSTGFYGTTSPGQPRFHCTQLGERQVAGQPMQVAKIVADKPLSFGKHYVMSQFEVFVRYREQAGEPTNQETQFVYWSEANDGSLSEPPQSFKVRLLPKLQGAQCKTLVWQLWGGWLGNMDETPMRQQVLACSRQSGFNDIVGGDRWTSDNGPKFGQRHTLGTNFRPWCLDLAPHLEAHPDERLLKSDGNHSETLMCMTLLLGSGWDAAEEQLRNQLDRIKPHTLDYDYEYPPLTGPHSCYCPNCLQAFREFADFPADAELAPETIGQRHKAQWVDFMAHRTARVFARFKDSVHRLSPGTLFSIYSGYHTPDNAERYGVDWRYVGDLQACDRAGAGYGRSIEAIAETVRVLKGIPLVGGALVVPYATAETTPQRPLTKAWLFRVLLDSTGGVLVYNRSTLDGRSWYAMAETTRLVAEYEEVFLKGKRTALAGQDPAQVQVVSAGRTTLVCALNQTSQVVTHKFALPIAAGAGKEFYGGKSVEAGVSVEDVLQPGDAAVYVLTK